MDRYTIMKYQLEYFYLIHTDEIVERIRQDICGKHSEPSFLLETVFKHVFEGISLYGDFIDFNSGHHFFNEDFHKETIRAIRQLLYLALQNNCILNAFFCGLSTAELPDIRISDKNEGLITDSIFKMIFPDPNEEKTKGQRSPQFFQNRARILKDPRCIDTYVNQVLEALNITDRKDEILSLTVMKYIAPAANFLFTEDACAKFNRALRNKKDIADRYTILWTKFHEYKDNYNSTIDKLIFESEMNHIFGFSFFRSIYKFIEEIHTAPVFESEEKSLKDLEGQLLTNILLQVANLPLYFNKEIFIKFACYAYLHSKNIDYTYFEESPNTLMAYMSEAKSKQQQIIYGLDLFGKFFQILSSVTLPVLFSLWEVVVHELNQKDHDLLNMETYKSYIEDNYGAIAYDYLSIPDDIIFKWGALDFMGKNHINNTLLLKYGKENPAHYEEITLNGNAKKYIFPRKSSKYCMDYIQQLIQSYCDIQMLKENRAPFFFLTENEMSAYSPLSLLIKALSAHTKFMKENKNVAEYTFLATHKNTIFHYLFSRK